MGSEMCIRDRGKPVSSLTRFIQGRPATPMPSKFPADVRGFQIPPLNISTLPVAAIPLQVSTSCSSVSTLQGPAITTGTSVFLNQFVLCGV